MHKRIPPPPPPRPPKRRRRNGFPLPCVCVLGIIMACVGDLWDADTYVVVDGRFSHESRPAGLRRLRAGLGLFFVDCPFFPLSRSGRHESMETGRTRERGDSSFNCCPVLSLLLVVRFGVRPLAPALQWRVRGRGPGGGTYRTRCFHFHFFIFHFSIFSSSSSSIHALLGKQPPLPSIVWSGGRASRLVGSAQYFYA